MACTFHSALTRYSNVTCPSTSITHSVTIPSGLTNPGLAIFICYERDTSQDVTAVAVAGNAATFAAANTTLTVGTAERWECWVIASPTTGTQDIVVSVADSGQDIAFFPVMVQGMDQTTMYGANAPDTDQTGSDEELSVVVTTTAADSLVLCGVSCTQFEKGPVTALTGTGVATADQVAIGSTTAGMAAWVGYVEATTASGYTIGATFTDTASSDVMAALGVELLAATGGGGGFQAAWARGANVVLRAA